MTREPASRPAARENVLLETGDHDDCDESACMDLLGVEEPREVDVLFVTVTKSAPERLDALRRHADAPPANVGVVSVQVGGSSGAAQVGGDGGPTVQRISDPSDLTGVGIAISEFLAAWGGNGNRTVVCFESLTALLQYVDASRVFQFCNEITSKFEQAGALAHFHITPGAHEPQVLNVLSSLFDSRVSAADLGHGPHAEEPTATGEATTELVDEERGDDPPTEDADDPFEYVARDPDPEPQAEIDDTDATEAGTEPSTEPSESDPEHEPESVDTEADDEAVEEIDLTDPREATPGGDGDVAADDPGDGDVAADHPGAVPSSDPSDPEPSGAGTDSEDPEPGGSDEPAARPKKYALYQRTTATVVGVVAMLVLLSFFAAAMPLPIGTDAPGTDGADVTPTPEPDSAAAADAANGGATVTEEASTPEPTATATSSPEPTPTARDTATATETDTAMSTSTPTPTAESTPTPEPSPTATEEDTSLTDGLDETTDGITDGVDETTDGISDTLDGDEEDDGSLL